MVGCKKCVSGMTDIMSLTVLYVLHWIWTDQSHCSDCITWRSIILLCWIERDPKKLYTKSYVGLLPLIQWNDSIPKCFPSHESHDIIFLTSWRYLATGGAINRHTAPPTAMQRHHSPYSRLMTLTMQACQIKLWQLYFFKVLPCHIFFTVYSFFNTCIAYIFLQIIL